MMARPGAAVALAAAMILCAWTLPAHRAHAEPAAIAPIAPAQNLYLMRCGGCHGIQGVSVPKQIPTLRGRVGVFLCSDAGRDYVLRLPNIQMSLIRDDGDLAAVLNFVVFGFGERSVPKDARPFTAAEVARTRHRPLDPATIDRQRDALIKAAGACGSEYRSAPDPLVPAPY